MGAGTLPPRGAAHRLAALWLLATAPLLVLPADGTALRLGLLALHAIGAAALLRAGSRPPSADSRGLRGTLYDFVPLVLAPVFYWEVPLLAAGIHGGVAYDATVLAWEAALFGGQPSRVLAAAWPWRWVSEPLHAAYLSFYFFIVVPAAALALARRFEAARLMIFTIVLVYIGHALIFTAFPVLGPRYLFPAPTGPLEHGLLYQLTHRVLESGSSPGTAFPSSHVGIAVAVTITLFRTAPRAAPWVGALAAALALSTVYGGFHYAVDVVAGLALGGGLALAAPAFRRRIGTRGGSA